jgi:hypothetical protein
MSQFGNVPTPPTAPPPSAAILQPPAQLQPVAPVQMSHPTSGTVAEGFTAVAVGSGTCIPAHHSSTSIPAHPPSYPPMATQSLMQPPQPLRPTQTLVSVRPGPPVAIGVHGQEVRPPVVQPVVPQPGPPQPPLGQPPPQHMHQHPSYATAHHNHGVTAASVLHEAISLPSSERVLFFNDLRLHLHREGLLSVRNRSKKQAPPALQHMVPGVQNPAIQKHSLG